MDYTNTIVLKRTNSIDPDFHGLIQLLDRDLNERYGALQLVYDAHNKIEYIDTVVIAYRDGEAVGCACFKVFDAQSVEIKRMFVHPSERGKGTASLILAELESWAAAGGYLFTVLETGTKQLEAIRLYQKLGYMLIDNYGPYVGMESSICMRKRLNGHELHE